MANRTALGLLFFGFAQGLVGCDSSIRSAPSQLPPVSQPTDSYTLANVTLSGVIFEETSKVEHLSRVSQSIVKRAARRVTLGRPPMQAGSIASQGCGRIPATSRQASWSIRTGMEIRKDSSSQRRRTFQALGTERLWSTATRGSTCNSFDDERARRLLNQAASARGRATGDVGNRPSNTFVSRSSFTRRVNAPSSV
jgi:hypothetical protein